MERALKVGCGCLLVVGMCCGVSLFLGPRLVGLVIPDPETAAARDPLDIEGDCSRDEVVAYLEDSDARWEQLGATMEQRDSTGTRAAGSGTGGDDQELLQSVDLAALRAARDELAALEVSPCLRAMRDEELALVDEVIDVVVTIRAKDQPSALDAGWAIFRLLQTVPRSLGRLRDARERLMERYDIPTATPEPAATGRVPG